MTRQNIERKPPKGSVRFSLSLSKEQKKAKTEKLQKIGAQKLRDFDLSEDDVEDIFDLIADEGPDL